MDTKKPFTQNLKEEAKTALDRTKAKSQEAKGVVKETVGKITDNPRLKAEGKADKFAGKVKDAVAQVIDASHDASEKAQKELHKKH